MGRLVELGMVKSGAGGQSVEMVAKKAKLEARVEGGGWKEGRRCTLRENSDNETSE